MKRLTSFGIIIGSFLVFGIAFLIYFLNSNKAYVPSTEQLVLQETLNISRSYTLLRMKTDDVLINARNYPTYEEWQKEMNGIIQQWSSMEAKAKSLENMALKMLDEKVSIKFFNSALAYDKQEISRIFDNAPAGKKIATLAKHLGVDAKKAYMILTQDQAQVQADAWNEAGDTFKKLENSAVVIKDTCKVVTYVGTIVATGGTSAVAAGGALTQAAVVVAGADLVLEVTDDAAKIALGDKNKISTVVGEARVVTEPAAAILMISTLPSNVTKAVDKLSAVTFGADQLNSSVQEGKVIGIKLPVPSKNPQNSNMTVSVLESEEVKPWIQEQGATETQESIQEIKESLTNVTNVGTEEKLKEPNNQSDTKNDNKVENEVINNNNQGSGKLVQIKFKNAANNIWVIDTEPYGSQDYRGELDAIYAKDFAVAPGETFIDINKPMNSTNPTETSSNFTETSNTTYEYRIQLIAGGILPEDEDEQYVYDPFVAVVDFTVKGTYGKVVTVVWDGASFRQLE
ncbi:MAG: hypothetical protein V3575_02115 [Candidatus Absconditabacteria bacterium]